RIAEGLQVVGLLNIQFAVKGSKIYVLEVNPRASRTVPFVSKATGVPCAKIAAQIMMGKRVKDFNLPVDLDLPHFSVKESVLPFSRFSGVDIVLGPEMKSTGEVMGIAMNFGEAFVKSQLCANQELPKTGRVFVSVKDEDKRAIVFLAKRLRDLQYTLVATQGTAKVLRSNGVVVDVVGKYAEGENTLLKMIKSDQIHLIINIPSGQASQSDLRKIRAAAILYNVPCITTLQGAWAAVNGMEDMLIRPFSVKSLQSYYRGMRLAGPVEAYQEG
nr:carbamoyl phosphate synthase large subunit [Candidatus Omnitrophota bacterium]